MGLHTYTVQLLLFLLCISIQRRPKGPNHTGPRLFCTPTEAVIMGPPLSMRADLFLKCAGALLVLILVDLCKIQRRIPCQTQEIKVASH